MSCFRVRSDPVSGGGSGRALWGPAADQAIDLGGMGAQGVSTADVWDELPQGDPPIIGRYRIVRRLGEGGFGRVDLARDDDLDRPVAIKVPSPGRVSGPDDVETVPPRGPRPGPARPPAHHPGPRCGPHRGRPLLRRFQVHRGERPGRAEGRGRWPFRESAELVAVVAEGRHHAHTRGVVHRDIKPANILIDLQGQPWVADFGLRRGTTTGARRTSSSAPPRT